MIKHRFVFSCCLALMGAKVALAFSSDGSTLTRVLSRNTSLTNFPIVLTATFTNNTTNTLHGFYYTEQIPSGLSVQTLSVKVNGQSVSNYINETGEFGDVFSGVTPVRWILERPIHFSESNAISPNGTVQIAYSLNSTSTGTFDLQDFSWVAMANSSAGTNSTPTNIPGAGLAALFPANEQTGNVLSNIVSGFGFSDSTTLSNPDWGSNYVHFQGPGSFAEFNIGASISNQMTVAGWFNFQPYSAADDSCIWIWSPDIYSGNGCILHTMPNGMFRLRYHNAVTGGWTGGDFPWGAITPSTWHHVAWMLDLTRGDTDLSVFVDGVPLSLVPYGTGVPTNSALDGGIWRLASYAPPAGNNCNYSVRMLALYNRVLAQAEVTNLIAATSGRPLPSAPIASFGFSEATDSQSVTFLGGQINPTITGAATGGGFTLHVSGIPGFTYSLQASSNLADWQTIGTNVSPFTFRDTNSIAFPQRFYRAVQDTSMN
jgi:hypothetical protein